MKLTNRKNSSQRLTALAIVAARDIDTKWVASRVGPVVEHLYPSGCAKMLARLWENLSFERGSYIVSAGDSPVAYFAETFKSASVVKISTIWVAPEAREHGVGTAMMHAAFDRWSRANVRRAYVTVRETEARGLSILLEKFGFEEIARVADRYGPGQTEYVYEWRAGRDEVSQETAHALSAD